MQIRYLLSLVVTLGTFSCSENSKPSAANHTIIKTNTKDSVAEALYQEGRTLFINNCATCHSVKSSLTGPALAGVEQRWKSKTLLYDYIKNSQAVIAKDAYAKALFNSYNKVEMTQFAWMKNEQIDLLLNYIKIEESK